MDTSNTTTPERLAAAERAGQAWELRKAGATFDQIARILGYSGRGAAHNAVMGVLKEIKLAPAEEGVKLAEAKLDKYLVALDPAIKKGDTKAILAAVKIEERRAKLLGLDDFERRMAEVNERKVQLQEREAAAVATMLANVIRKMELPADKVDLARELIMGELKALGTRPDVIQGELA